MVKLKTIKVTEATITNLNIASAFAKKKQWEISQEAAEDVLKKITDKIKGKKK